MPIQLKLNTSELAVLFSMVSATSVAGFPQNVFLSSDLAESEAQYQAGLESLQASGWMTADPQNRFNIHSELMLYISAIASPDSTLIISREAETGRQTITYYWAQNYIVEQYFMGDHAYAITIIESVDQLHQRIADFLNLPDHAQQNIMEELPNDYFQQLVIASTENQHQTVHRMLADTSSNPLLAEIVLSGMPWAQMTHHILATDHIYNMVVTRLPQSEIFTLFKSFAQYVEIGALAQDRLQILTHHEA